MLKASNCTDILFFVKKKVNNVNSVKVQNKLQKIGTFFKKQQR